MWREWLNETHPMHICRLADILGVLPESLEMMECAWNDRQNCWAMPMRDQYNEIVGLQLRWEDGFKKTLSGSHNGMFIPRQKTNGCVVVTEGASDCAAALSLGLCAIGRHSCCDSVQRIASAIRNMRVSRAIIVADPDEPGIRGATKLAEQMPVPCCVYIPPAEDFRTAYRNGLTPEMWNASIDSISWSK